MCGCVGGCARVCMCAGVWGEYAGVRVCGFMSVCVLGGVWYGCGCVDSVSVCRCIAVKVCQCYTRCTHRPLHES